MEADEVVAAILGLGGPAYKRERTIFSKCLLLVHLTLLGGVPSQILTLTIYHNTLPLISKGVGGLWVQILVATSDLTMIDIRQKDLPLSDA